MMKVLVVDDSTLARVVLKNSLPQLGCHVVGEATNGQEAVESYFDLRPDLVMMDINMPVMDGITAIKKITAKDPCAKIIVCSIMGQPAYISSAILAGAIDFLVKPFQVEKLADVVSKLAPGLCSAQ